jgi:hypothetical protein
MHDQRMVLGGVERSIVRQGGEGPAFRLS